MQETSNEYYTVEGYVELLDSWHTAGVFGPQGQGIKAASLTQAEKAFDKVKATMSVDGFDFTKLRLVKHSVTHKKEVLKDASG